jgi:DNA repair/transcription protein MET18/MMS19
LVGGITLRAYIEQLAHDAITILDNTVAERTYQVMVYYATAALARCDPSDRVIIVEMIAGLKHKTLGKKVAQSFRLLLEPSKSLLKENFAIIRPLRQGRLYAYSVDAIVSEWRAATDKDIKDNYLIALVGILSHMEPSVYLDNVDVVFPLLLASTDIQDNDAAKLACIKIVANLIPVCPRLVTSHLDSIVNRMTDRTRNTYYSPSDATVECRAAAIDVLTLLTKYVPKPELIKRKAKVMAELDIAVDDGSVLVRDRAHRCKWAWFDRVGLVEE